MAAQMSARSLMVFGMALGQSNARTALLVIDVQDCFLEAACTSSGLDGSLRVPACHVIDKINSLREQKSCLFDEVIFTQDYHPNNHISYASTHGLAPFAHLSGKGGLDLKCISPESGLTEAGACCPAFHINPSMDCSANLCPPTGWSYEVNNSGIVTDNAACTACATDGSNCFDMEQAMWTDHCLQTGDSGFPSALDKRENDTVVQKGANQFVDAYSGFMDNTQTLKTALDDILKQKQVTTLFVVGIATDVCVQWTVTDALGFNTADYSVTVIKDATAAVQGDVANYNAAIDTMAAAGATIATTDDVLSMQCGEVSGVASCCDKYIMWGLALALLAWITPVA